VAESIMTTVTEAQQTEALNAHLARRQMEDEIRRHAKAAHKDFPQYRNHWDGWTLFRVLKRIKTKGGVAFEAGDVTIGTRIVDPNYPIEELRVRTVLYSTRRGNDVVLKDGIAREAR
jgi:hypothetical protein